MNRWAHHAAKRAAPAIAHARRIARVRTHRASVLDIAASIVHGELFVGPNVSEGLKANQLQRQAPSSRLRPHAHSLVKALAVGAASVVDQRGLVAVFGRRLAIDKNARDAHALQHSESLNTTKHY